MSACSKETGSGIYVAEAPLLFIAPKKSIGRNMLAIDCARRPPRGRHFLDGKERLNPRNGLCLAKTHDAAFDRHLITLDERFRVVLSKSIRDHFASETISVNFRPFEGRPIELPQRFAPDPKFVDRHREIFSRLE